MGQVQIQEITAPAPGQLDADVVERKGLGHPDRICDLVMERISQALSRAYVERFGRILRH